MSGVLLLSLCTPQDNAMATKNPNKIRTHTIRKFRSVAASDLKTSLPKEFVNDSMGTVSLIMGEVRKQAGASISERLTDTGEIVGIRVQDGGRIVAMGGSVYAEAESVIQQIPIDDWV